MKTDPHIACGQQPRPTRVQASRSLPFCGLGAEDYVQGKAAQCGLTSLRIEHPRAEGARALPIS